MRTRKYQQTGNSGLFIKGDCLMNLTSSIWFLAFTMLLTTNSFAQHSFKRMYGGGGYDRGESVQQTTDGGYIITGFTF